MLSMVSQCRLSAHIAYFRVVPEADLIYLLVDGEISIRVSPLGAVAGIISG